MRMHLPGAAASDDDTFRPRRIGGENDADFGEIRLRCDHDGVPEIR